MQDEIALIMAAGKGVRMLPLTKKIAKPLITVDGIPMIETIIKALNERGVSKIYIVTGYKKEQFKYLKSKYKNTELIENKEYKNKNNISSLKAAERIVGHNNCFVCEADLYIRDPSVFMNDFKQSCYFGKFINGHSNDWCFEVNNGQIVSIKKGGYNLYNMSGISYWLKDDILKIKEAVLQAYHEPAHKNLFWDEIVNIELININMGLHIIKKGQIFEIDTIDELKNIVYYVNLCMGVIENG